MISWNWKLFNLENKSMAYSLQGSHTGQLDFTNDQHDGALSNLWIRSGASQLSS